MLNPLLDASFVLMGSPYRNHQNQASAWFQINSKNLPDNDGFLACNTPTTIGIKAPRGL